MSIGSVEEAKAVTGLIKGVKILVPFAVSIASIVGVYYATDNRITALEKSNSKLEAKVEEQGKIITNHGKTIVGVKTDIQHIKDDTKETLDLVRALYMQR